jgi:hypothetical protein
MLSHHYRDKASSFFRWKQLKQNQELKGDRHGAYRRCPRCCVAASNSHATHCWTTLWLNRKIAINMT